LDFGPSEAVDSPIAGAIANSLYQFDFGGTRKVTLFGCGGDLLEKRILTVALPLLLFPTACIFSPTITALSLQGAATR
jgi:hypothetical protein